MSVQIRNLNVWYGQAQALHDVNLTIESQGATAIIGPSGCGKSTFVRCLNRMHEEVHGGRVKGEVLIDDINIYARSIKPMYVRRHIGMVFQRPNPLPALSIFDNVAIGLRLNGLASGSALKEIVERSLKQAALWDEVKDRLGESASQLSGGQQQRLCIARTLVIEPKVLLMDEPCSALDPISTFQVEELIRELKQNYTVVIVTHNMQQAGRVADRTVFFLQGKLIEEGETAGFFAHPQKKETEDYISGRFG
ncbi:MAG TPA: phosphate ABC transporter ATP-binding protein PstB [Ktedonobacteraceae bacterium]|nr:phosphate ABC transporter ATP-binding protein PstB [Ktedonobacteraceae bacterium]